MLEKYLKDNKAKYEYESLRFPYIVEHNYIPDFVFPKTRILVEAKGWFTGADRSKILKVRPAIREAGWELRFCFQQPHNKLNPRSKTTYATWCDKHGFIWSELIIPKEWYDAK